MKKILLAAIFCACILVSGGFSQDCGQGRFTLEITFEKQTYPPQEVNYQLYFVYPKNKRTVTNEELWDYGAMFYYGKKQKYPAFFWKMYQGDRATLRVSKEKAEKYIKAYNLSDYKELASNFEERFIKQLSGQSEFGKIVFHTYEIEDTPLLLKIEKTGYKSVYLFSNFWGGCDSEVTIEMKPIKKSQTNGKQGENNVN